MHVQPARRPLRLATLALLIGLAACASPTVINTQWSDPMFTAKPMRSIIVFGITNDSTNRRVFEDAMVAQLSAKGVKASPSYRFAPDPGPVSQEVMQRAIAESGAGGVLLTRIVNVSQSVRVTPGTNFGPPPPGWGGWGGFGGFHGFYGGMWASNFNVPPTITVDENVGADTRLFEAKDFSVVWSASTTTTTGFANATTLIQQFATQISGAMAKDGFI